VKISQKKNIVKEIQSSTISSASIVYFGINLEKDREC